MQKQHKLVD